MEKIVYKGRIYVEAAAKDPRDEEMKKMLQQLLIDVGPARETAKKINSFYKKEKKKDDGYYPFENKDCNRLAEKIKNSVGFVEIAIGEDYGDEGIFAN